MNKETTDQTELAALAQMGDETAKTALVVMNEKFVIMVARQYMGQGLELDDLIQEGNIGLLKAIDLYDTKSGNKFLTYASWWIKNTILLALAEHNRQVRLPANRINMLERYKKIKMSLAQELMREPTQAEILDVMGIDENELYEQSSSSIHSSHGVYDKSSIGELSMLDKLADSNSTAPDEILMKESFQKELAMILQKLDERERIILTMSYGIGYERQFTLEEIGEKLGLTRERIRQLKEKVLKQLRRMNRRNKLEGLKN